MDSHLEQVLVAGRIPWNLYDCQMLRELRSWWIWSAKDHGSNPERISQDWIRYTSPEELKTTQVKRKIIWTKPSFSFIFRFQVYIPEV